MTETKKAPDQSIKRTHIPYDHNPDFSKPLLKISNEAREDMFSRLTFLYGESEAEKCLPELERILKVHHAFKPQALIDAEKGYDPRERFTERDLVLIAYGDTFKGEKGETLAILHQTVQTHNSGSINTIHLLPFFPYSSDKGFAVVDFRSVDPKMGTWECIREMDVEYDLMFDGVMNHCSSRSQMFQEFLLGTPRFQDFFIAYDFRPCSVGWGVQIDPGDESVPCLRIQMYAVMAVAQNLYHFARVSVEIPSGQQVCVTFQRGCVDESVQRHI